MRKKILLMTVLALMMFEKTNAEAKESVNFHREDSSIYEPYEDEEDDD
jgi:hypothetical protein